jgi:exodeoxyribonuclease-3
VRIATYNVNGVNGRLKGLLDWLRETQPDVVCLQELKAPEEKFPQWELKRAGYRAIWHGQSRWNGVAILAKGCTPIETRRGLPGDRTDVQSRYVEAAVRGVIVASLYVPNGNPQPGPRFEFKKAWLELGAPCLGPAGDGPAGGAGGRLQYHSRAAGRLCA